MIDYIVFFSLLSLAFAAYLFHKPQPQTVQIDEQYVKCESPIEFRLYRALKHNGYYVESQTPCGPYRIDLTLPSQRIAIECDGKAFHSSKKQKAHDRKKDAYLKRSGWRVLRFSGSAINGRMPQVLYRIEKELTK